MPLDREQIEKMLSQEKARKAKTEGQSRFFDDFKLKQIALAVSRNQSKVILEGKEYNIERRERWPSDVLVTPADKRFVPSGWFNKDKLRAILNSGV